MAAGINIYEGYGLTEAGPCLTVNDFKRGMKIGTVGVPLIHIDIQLAEDGEILARGKNIMKGYYKNPEATAEVLKGGWLHTGDIGVWEDGKYLKIVDRKKEMFKTSGGKYVVPQQIEKVMMENKFISQMMVIGENRKFPAALIIPAHDAMREYLKSTGRDVHALSDEELILLPEVKNKIEDEVKALNKNFGNWEQIKSFALLVHEWSVESGELTPTLKMKRKIIEKKYADEVVSIYGH